MSKKVVVFVSISITVIAILIIIYSQIPNRVNAQKYDFNEKQLIEELIKDSIVFADVNKDCYLTENINGKKIKKVKENSKVEILQDRGTQYYKVKCTDDNTEGWIDGNYLNIPQDPETNNDKMSNRQIEDYINIMNFESDTDYFVWVDIDRQVVNILKGEKGKWNFVKSITCATGKNQSPTTRGNYKIKDRGKWFYSERLGSGAKYWVRFNGSYLFHSVSMDKNKNVIDNVLGERRSSGCVRMSIGDSRWFFEKIPQNTSVFIN